MTEKDRKTYKKMYEDTICSPYISYIERIKTLKAIKTAIQGNIELVSEALSSDLNKHKNEAYFSEIGLVLKELSLTISQLKKWMKPKRAKTPILLFGGSSKLIPQAMGIALIISPWNYPFYLSLMPIISAIAAGNRVILKPSESSPETSYLLTNLFNNTVDSRYIYVMSSDVDSTKEMLMNKFDIVFFTGSQRVGSLVRQQLCSTNTAIILELGGKCPVIIDQNLNIDQSVEKVFNSKVINAGQTCVAPDYVAIHKDKIDIFIDKFNKLSSEFEKHIDEYPKIINKKHFDRLLNLAKNTELTVKDTKILPKAIKTTFNSELMVDEIFGPLLPVVSYSEISEVLDFIKSNGEPLATYVFTKSKNFENVIVERVHTGAVVTNEIMLQLANYNLPFGGVGSSGWGRSHGYQGFLAFSNVVSCYSRWGFGTKLNTHPYTDKKINLIKKFLK
ncbi:hypothetical protein MCAL106E_0072 [Mycoplasmopsis californica]|uniref:aldehyde dehydrogenase family protein n=1 Tax=Mycoplasmopsis californica TaxID=2113 RepID=UPI000EB67E71|nr:aldehyde dehydrogenase family protein [Mycoplasmopsis californica]BBG41265.1 hypothetical protein MCAL106E_0072 [Mycoplasmopsis californica]